MLACRRSPTLALLSLLALLVVGGCSRQDDAAADADAPRIGGPEDYDYILQKYVDGEYFRYGDLLANAEDLARFEAFLRWQAEADLSDMSREEQIAFYINAYNACCIKGILDHYPVNSPKAIPGYFDELKYRVAGEELTVNEIEYERLIANYEDMRAHFAVNCADRGCLPLAPRAYRGQTLNEDLERAARQFVSDPRQFQVDPERKLVRVSTIFDWYGEKFLEDPELPVEGDQPVRYLANWVDEATRRLLESEEFEVEFIEWDWTLNEQSAPPFVEPEETEDATG